MATAVRVRAPAVSIAGTWVQIRAALTLIVPSPICPGHPYPSWVSAIHHVLPSHCRIEVQIAITRIVADSPLRDEHWNLCQQTANFVLVMVGCGIEVFRVHDIVTTDGVANDIASSAAPCGCSSNNDGLGIYGTDHSYHLLMKLLQRAPVHVSWLVEQ